MDYFSHHVANALVGNDPAAAALESVFIGPTLHFRRDTVVAVTGAEVGLRLDGVSMPTWTTLPVRAGQVLTVGPALKGLRSYIAVRGGIGTPVVMGSRSTYLQSGIGGVDGRELRADDVLSCADQFGPYPRLGYVVDESLRPSMNTHQEIRIVLGLCSYRFTDVSIEKMLSSEFTVGTEANRVGYRLSGPPLEFIDREAPPRRRRRPQQCRRSRLSRRLHSSPRRTGTDLPPARRRYRWRLRDYRDRHRRGHRHAGADAGTEHRPAGGSRHRPGRRGPTGAGLSGGRDLSVGDVELTCPDPKSKE